jgi:hypothetical protein
MMGMVIVMVVGCFRQSCWVYDTEIAESKDIYVYVMVVIY